MHWIEAIILGLVQGLTEFLPVSSSAHLRIVGELLPDGKDPGAAFTAITQLGTELAVLIYFWKDFVRIISRWFGSLTGRVPRNDQDARMGWLIIVGSIPIVVFGLLLKDAIETSFRSLWIVGTTLIVFGVILGVADAVGRQVRKLEDLTVPHGLIYGFAQALALIPGVSRSGGTITAGLLMGYTREAAARYSFLLAMPAVFASGLYELYGALKSTSPTVYTMPQTALATVIAFGVGYAIIAWFLRYISHNSFRPFVWYRIGLGVVVYILLGTGVISA
ncbi:undecaprenyl-diphosphate phosphatase [Falsarthrobacter nasiphocae]|uniref:Undecaprenyl-diphosphatase n=1 Tax=Falsarthrobacter nasiphocae TaxID=189863 RepID=A0AAE4C753_9MICC|nr:undecaprenyl-diphosphate phosphatase [Falsarthrobacter nasiphocae]MDR6891115.1 undecaprenyl-diphosphatase [Falsarthrobacter nasiphocae]